MGIPQYFKYVRLHHPSILRQVDIRNVGKTDEAATESDSATPDNLLLDFNCAVHRCARVLLERLESFDKLEGGGGQYASSPSFCDTSSPSAFCDAVIRETFVFIDRLVRYARPRHRVFVAVDGVPPRSKMVQQRNRRFMAQWARQRKQSRQSADETTSLWDPNAVTPGTGFMEALSAELHRRFDVSDVSDGCVVDVSDHNEPGEGEQKIFGALRAGRYAGRTLVYGLDADLLVLSSLCLEVDRNLELRVLRPADGCTPPGQHDHIYYEVDMPAFRRIIHDKMRTDDEDDDVASTRDYAVLCSLLGNDFVPGLACLPVSNASISYLMDAYREIRGKSGHKRLSWMEEGMAYVETSSLVRIDEGFLGQILERIADTEDERMTAADRDYYAQVRDHAARANRMNRMNRMTRTNSGGGAAATDLDMDRYPLSHPYPDNRVRPSERGWRLRYYHHLFVDGSGRGGSSVVAEACANYLEALTWSINYHGQRPIDGTWWYRFAYAPTALDLANHIIATSSASRPSRDRTVVSVSDHGLSPEMQMLMVLPAPSVAAYLGHRPELVRITREVDLGCVHYYPVDFRVLTYLKRYTSECAPVLPDIDHVRIREACRRASAATTTNGKEI